MSVGVGVWAWEGESLKTERLASRRSVAFAPPDATETFQNQNTLYVSRDLLRGNQFEACLHLKSITFNLRERGTTDIFSSEPH